MANFEFIASVIDSVVDHPDADRLSILSIGGYKTISSKLDDGSDRYKEGDLVAYVPEGAVVPEYLLKQGFWDAKNEKEYPSGTCTI